MSTRRRVYEALTGELVRVDWVDSASQYGWRHDHEVGGVDLACESVGWVFETLADRIILVASRGADNFYSPLSIPKCAITKIRRLAKS